VGFSVGIWPWLCAAASEERNLKEADVERYFHGNAVNLRHLNVRKGESVNVRDACRSHAGGLNPAA
jgi:hypothetical protein